MMFIKDLSFKFDRNSSHYFFKGLTAKFAPNKVHFILGDNGVGKTTLFNIIQGTTDPMMLLQASITLEGTTYTTSNNVLSNKFTQQVHTVKQNYDTMIANKFTFMENLQLANLPTYPSVKPLPHATLFDITKPLHIDVNTQASLLSGGQRQLLAIVMALQKPTKILLLDEPTATLDKKNAHLIMHCLYKLATQLNITILIICHDKELVDHYAQGNSFIMRQLESGERVLEVLTKKTV